MNQDFSRIHQFSIKDTNIVLDINSGIVHSLSPEAALYLRSWADAEGSRERLPELLKGEIAAEELQEISSGLDALIEQGMLFSAGEELAGYELPEETVVKALCLHVAHDCNLRCAYCFAGTGPFGSDRSMMDFSTGQAALDFLFAASGPRKHLEVDYFGGEPLLNFELVRQLSAYGKAKAASLGKELKQTLTTNGVLLDQSKIEFLEKEGIYLILSIDGRPEVHDRMRPFAGSKGSYDIVCSAIRKYVQQQSSDTYFVRGTYTRYNLDFVEDVRHLVEQGFTRLSLEPVVASPEEHYALREEDLPQIFDQYDQLAEQLLVYDRQNREVQFFHFNIDLDKGPCLPKRLTGCGAGHEYLAVSPMGELYPCHQFMNEKALRVGDVCAGITNPEPGRSFRRAHVLNKEHCRECWARFLCSGGCHANALHLNSDILKPYELGCSIQRKRLEAAIYLQVKRWEALQEE